MRWWIAALLGIGGGLLLLPCPAPGMGLCMAIDRSPTFRVEMDGAKIVVDGVVIESDTGPDCNSDRPEGVTKLRLNAIVKGHPFLAGRMVFEIKRYIPVLDPKKPPRYVIFCDV